MPDAQPTPPDDASGRRERLRRRLIAARAIAGLTVEELASTIRQAGHERGYSASTLGKMERGESPIQPQTLPVLADACQVPPEFFTADFSRLTDGASDLGRRVGELEAQLAEDSARLAQLEEDVQTLTAKGRPPQDGEASSR